VALVALVAITVLLAWQLAAAQTNSIPGWIKTVAEFWVGGQVSDEEFINALQYLIDHGILKVAAKENIQTESDKDGSIYGIEAAQKINEMRKNSAMLGTTDKKNPLLYQDYSTSDYFLAISGPDGWAAKVNTPKFGVVVIDEKGSGPALIPFECESKYIITVDEDDKGPKIKEEFSIEAYKNGVRFGYQKASDAANPNEFLLLSGPC